MKFLDWIIKRDENFNATMPSDVGDAGGKDTDIPPLETRGAFPFYSDEEKPPVPPRLKKEKCSKKKNQFGNKI
jgi:hypothetical protein